MSKKKLKMRVARLEMRLAHLERLVGDMDFLVQMVECTLRATNATRAALGCCGSWAISPQSFLVEADAMLDLSKANMQYYSDAWKETNDALTHGDTDVADHADVQAGHDA